MTTTMIKMITIVPMPIYMEWLLPHRTAPAGRLFDPASQTATGWAG
jgi:hypothetical protein